MALLRKFEHKLLERIDRTVRLSELCTALHVTERTLEHLVKTEYGITPKQFYGVLRLNAARQDLLKSRASDETVREIAQRNGIHHLGRFSANYMHHFGEYPSETLRSQ
jgi:AraC family ethanolamine operon transcriptional activator